MLKLENFLNKYAREKMFEGLYIDTVNCAGKGANIFEPTMNSNVLSSRVGAMQ